MGIILNRECLFPMYEEGLDPELIMGKKPAEEKNKKPSTYVEHTRVIQASTLYMSHQADHPNFPNSLRSSGAQASRGVEKGSPQQPHVFVGAGFLGRGSW